MLLEILQNLQEKSSAEIVIRIIEWIECACIKFSILRQLQAIAAKLRPPAQQIQTIVIVGMDQNLILHIRKCNTIQEGGLFRHFPAVDFIPIEHTERQLIDASADKVGRSIVVIALAGAGKLIAHGIVAAVELILADEVLHCLCKGDFGKIISRGGLCRCLKRKQGQKQQHETCPTNGPLFHLC